MTESISEKRRIILYALGSNGNSQLGLEHDKDVSRPGRCRFHPPTTLSSTFDEQREVLDYVPLREDEHIKKLVAGGNHTVLLTSHGRVFAAGSDVEGQRSLKGPDGYDGQEFRIHDSPPSVSTARTATNADLPVLGVWQHLPWTGQRDTDDSSQTGGYSRAMVTDIAATWTASYFIVNGTRIYCCGTGSRGELGLGSHIASSPTPQKCFDLRDVEIGDPTSIVDMSGCMNHVVVLSSSGKAYGWGASRKGQLGEGLRGAKSIWTPSEVGLNGLNAKKVITGKDFTVVLAEGGKVLFLGNLLKNAIQLPNDLAVEDGMQVFAGWTSVSTLSPSGVVHTHGSARRTTTPRETLEPGQIIEELAVGSEHSVAITNNGHVIAWGWGEHGNCGEPVDDKGNVTEQANSICVPKENERVVGVAAGCATSFFWVVEEAQLQGDTG